MATTFVIKIQISKCGKSGCKDEPLATKEEEQVFFFVVVAILIPFLTVFQATRCSFSGKLASDPDSTVYISGCAEKESMDISVMSKKVNATRHDICQNIYTTSIFGAKILHKKVRRLRHCQIYDKSA